MCSFTFFINTFEILVCKNFKSPLPHAKDVQSRSINESCSFVLFIMMKSPKPQCHSPCFW